MSGVAMSITENSLPSDPLCHLIVPEVTQRRFITNHRGSADDDLLVGVEFSQSSTAHDSQSTECQDIAYFFLLSLTLTHFIRYNFNSSIPL